MVQSIFFFGGLIGIVIGVVAIYRQRLKLPPAGSFEDDDVESEEPIEDLTGRDAVKAGLIIAGVGILLIVISLFLGGIGIFGAFTP